MSKIPSCLVAVFIAALAWLPAFSSAADDAKPELLSARFKPLAGAAKAKMSEAIKDALEKAANGTTSAIGTGTVENEFIRKKNLKEFKFWLKKPGRLLLEFTGPEDIKGTVMASDSKTFWTYIPAMKKTQKVDLDRDKSKGRDKPLQNELGLLVALVNTPLERKVFWEKFELSPLGEEKIDGSGCYVTELRVKSAPKEGQKEGMFNQYLWIDKVTGLTRQIELLVFGAQELVKIKSIQLNQKIDDSIFIPKD